MRTVFLGGTTLRMAMITDSRTQSLLLRSSSERRHSVQTVNTMGLSTVGLMLGQRRRRWPINKPAVGQHPGFSGSVGYMCPALSLSFIHPHVHLMSLTVCLYYANFTIYCLLHVWCLIISGRRHNSLPRSSN